MTPSSSSQDAFHRSLKIARGSVRATFGVLALSMLLLGCATTRPAPTPEAPAVDSPVSGPVVLPVAAEREAHIRASMRPWEDTPHVFGGMALSGADCSGFVVSLYRDAFGVDLPRTTRDQARAGVPVSRGELAAGDLVFFRPGSAINHVGVYLSEGRFAHISTSRGFIVSHLEEPYWRRRYATARRVLDAPPEVVAMGDGPFEPATTPPPSEVKRRAGGW